MARFLSAAMISGPLAVRNWRWSSPVTTSLTRWGRFSIPRCPWIQTATTSGRAWSMGSEQTRVDHLNSRLRSDCLSAAILARFLAVLGGLGASDPDHHEAQEHGQERQGQAQDVSAGWHDGTCLSPAPSPRNTHVLAGEERNWERGEGRVQAERATCQSPPGQGNGPEGERRTQLDRSPDPGRRCPGGCPQQVDRLGHPLARGVARLAPGWLPTIMAGTAPLCPQSDETHQGCPRRRLGASRRDAREVRGPWWAREVGCRYRPGPRSRAGTPGRMRRRRRRTRGGDP